MKNQIIRLPAVKAQTGLSRSTIYLRISEGAFPASIPLGPRAVGWNAADIDRWIDDRIQSVAHRTPKGTNQKGGVL